MTSSHTPGDVREPSDRLAPDAVEPPDRASAEGAEGAEGADLADPLGGDARVGDMLQALLRRTHLSPAQDLAEILAEEAGSIHAGRVVLYLLDYEQKTLIPVPAPDAQGRPPLEVQGTVAGRAFMTGAITQIPLDGRADGSTGRRVWLPLIDGTDRLGVMEMEFPDAHVDLPESRVATCERYAHFAAMLVVSKDAYSDHFESLRRRQEMSLASELLWSLVPPLVFATEDFMLGALLEPCYDMGGDAFDYSLDDGILHFGVFDGMGHGLTAAGVTAFALSAYRHSRRRGEAPSTTYAAIDTAVAELYPDSRFVTAVIAQLELATGRLRWVSAGHPAPLLLRDSRLVKTLEAPPAPPMGLQLLEQPVAEGEEWLEPGDMVLAYTDGLTEARRPDGELFSVERLAEFIERQAAGGQPAPETLRRLRHAIIERQAGALRDDATALLVEWRRGSEYALLPDNVTDTSND